MLRRFKNKNVKLESRQLDEAKRVKISELAFDFSKVWNNPKVSYRVRKN
jgi:hypothetical protein